MRRRVAVVGAGIVGAAVARDLIRRLPDAEVTVFDKADHAAAHQTGHNSGVVHAGLYYAPGSLKARLCRRGVDLLRAFCADQGLPYVECGKVVVALNDEELPRLHAIHERALANGVPGAALIGRRELAELEPNAIGLAAVHSPHTAIVDYPAITRALLDDVRAAGGRVRMGAEVRRVVPGVPRVSIETGAGSESFDLAIACAGLQSDRLARASGGAPEPRIVPFFGQYFRLASEHRDAVRGLIYPVPDPRYPFLGVHLTKRVDGELLAGPNAFLSLAREGYTGLALSVPDALAVATDPGFWRFAARNLTTAGRELATVLSSRRFLREAARYVPSLAGVSAEPLPRGVRAQAMAADGSLVDDFVITHLGGATHVRNAPSPGATSSMAIAEHIVTEVAGRHGLELRPE